MIYLIVRLNSHIVKVSYRDTGTRFQKGRARLENIMKEAGLREVGLKEAGLKEVELKEVELKEVVIKRSYLTMKTIMTTMGTTWQL